MNEIKANDASLIPQPDYADLWDAYKAGFYAAQSYPNASAEVLEKAADAHCKLVHLRRAPESFTALGKEAQS